MDSDFDFQFDLDFVSLLERDIASLQNPSVPYIDPQLAPNRADGGSQVGNQPQGELPTLQNLTWDMLPAPLNPATRELPASPNPAGGEYPALQAREQLPGRPELESDTALPVSEPQQPAQIAPPAVTRRRQDQKNRSQTLLRQRQRWLKKNAEMCGIPGGRIPKYAMEVRDALIRAMQMGVDVPRDIQIRASELHKAPAGKGSGRRSREHSETTENAQKA